MTALDTHFDVTRLASDRGGSNPYQELAALGMHGDRISDPQVLLRAAQLYVQLGLAASARELLAGIPENGHSAERAALIEMLISARDGRISWGTCNGRFRRNIDAWAARCPEAGELPSIWDAVQDKYQLYRTVDGNYQLRSTPETGGGRWLSALADHRRLDEARPLPYDEKSLMPAPCVFEGLGFGWYFRRVHEATQHTFLNFSAPLFVVEPDPIWFAISLHLHDWRDVLGDPRVMLFVGSDAIPRFERALNADRDLQLPGAHVYGHAWNVTRDGSVIKAVERAGRRRERLNRRSLGRMQARYADRTAMYWAQRFATALNGDGPPLRILAVTSRYTTFLQYSMRDAVHALESLGHRTKLLIEPSDHHALGSASYHRAILDFDPDLYFILDHLRYSHRRHLPDNLPMFTWDQDLLPHVFTRQHIAQQGPLDVIGGITKRHCVTGLGCDEQRYCNAIMPTDPDVYSAEPLPDEDLKPYRCDVSYVSNASQTAASFHEQERAKLDDPRGKRLLDVLYEGVIRLAQQGLVGMDGRRRRLLADAQRRTGTTIQNDDLLNYLENWYLWRLGDRIYRHQALEWVADWVQRTGRRFHLYGRGWDTHPRFAAYARGVAQNGRELRCVYQATAINLQIMPSGFIHQRSMDGLAAGGFFLTRSTPADHNTVPIRRVLGRLEAVGAAGLDDPRAAADTELQLALREYERQTGHKWDPADEHYLTTLRIAAEQPAAGEVFPEFGTVLFNNGDEFADRAEHFLSQPSLRRSVADRMRRIVLERFTYQRTMERFLHFMRDYLARMASRPDVAGGDAP
ncbi:MAG: glycosyltransferase family 1 protein [Planctomycetes bacterium]|nr:glycosyltransferase family 1 protein [Planctomycetota bacterium]